MCSEQELAEFFFLQASLVEKLCKKDSERKFSIYLKDFFTRRKTIHVMCALLQL